MKDGKIVESGPTLALLQNPAEDYTRALIASAAEGVAA
jgi:ABC-type microcin C transport system duplicated ATPase subunit YejF